MSYGQTSTVLLRGNVQLRLDERLFGDVAHALGITIVSFQVGKPGLGLYYLIGSRLAACN